MKSISETYYRQFYPSQLNDFIARIEWAEKGQGNRNPVAVVNGENGTDAIVIMAKAGQTISLDASASFDPDGDELTFKWWQQDGISQAKATVSNATAYEQYALRSYDFNVVDYLLKPIPYARFSKAIVKARKLLQKDLETEGVDYIVVKVTQTKRHKILFRDITYIEAQQNYCNIHHRDDTTLMVRTTLNKILEQLPSDMFCQVHRSFIVNKTRITSMDSSRINIGGVSIPVSRTYKEKLL